MRILIAVPTFESIYPDTFKSIYDLDRGGHEVLFEYVRGYDCAAARNRIAELAMSHDADYVLMVDSDMVLPSDALLHLLEDPKDICLGYCAGRNAANTYDRTTRIYKLGERNYNWRFTVDEMQLMSQDPDSYKIEVHGGGMACALIRTTLFKQLEYPWFYWTNYQSREVLSEDLYFCEQCHQHGIKVYADTRVGCGHIFRYVQEVM